MEAHKALASSVSESTWSEEMLWLVYSPPSSSTTSPLSVDGNGTVYKETNGGSIFIFILSTYTLKVWASADLGSVMPMVVSLGEILTPE